MQLHLIKTAQGAFVPIGDIEIEKAQRFKVGGLVKAEVTQTRNGKFHRKFFAMLDIGFDAWEPQALEYNGMTVHKNRDRFRKDCIITAGFYDAIYDLNGHVRLVAHSISFGSMDDAEFERVYSAVADVLLRKILKHYTRGDLDSVVDKMMGFI